MKKIIKMYDTAVELRLRAEHARNDTCYTRDQQEERYENIMFEADEAESALFAEIRKLKEKPKKKEKSVVPSAPVWPYPPT